MTFRMGNPKFLKITKHVSGLNSEWRSGERVAVYSRAPHTGTHTKTRGLSFNMNIVTKQKQHSE